MVVHRLWIGTGVLWRPRAWEDIVRFRTAEGAMDETIPAGRFARTAWFLTDTGDLRRRGGRA